ncbi:MAG: ATP synthase F0 subunit B [Thermodesulfobacteriota bacterium]
MRTTGTYNSLFNLSKSAKKTVLMAVTVCLLLTAAGLCAASEGNAEVIWKKTDWYKVLNFAVLAIALIVAVRKPVSNALNGRIEKIKEDLKVLEAEKEAAEKQLNEYTRRIASLDQEVEAILKDYRQQGEAAKERILASARESADKITEQVKRNIENEFEVARKKLREDIFDQAVVRAEVLVKGKITSADQDRLVEEYLEKVVL